MQPKAFSKNFRLVAEISQSELLDTLVFGADFDEMMHEKGINDGDKVLFVRCFKRASGEAIPVVGNDLPPNTMEVQAAVFTSVIHDKGKTFCGVFQPIGDVH